MDGRVDETQRVYVLARFPVALLASLLFRYLPKKFEWLVLLNLRIFAPTSRIHFYVRIYYLFYV